VLQAIKDNPERPVYFSRTSGSYGQELGFSRYLLTQGLARKLLPAPPTAGRDTLLVPREGWFDLATTVTLWNNVFLGPRALVRRGDWVDAASVGIPLLYVTTAVSIAETEQRLGNGALSTQFMNTAQALAKVTGVQGVQ
jgi:hypothetical protein